ncbi:MAG TPA: DUF1338 family protein [Phenylobacterium sp.]|uniref:2-oxoadipate dioxygenase/decarboxylase family protein n=1 Tax=Phenylobacterium sp. TaxID=1871053 RepID=UPI002B49B5C0|nr:DUF1338 family protein [Phenylobacterium sp.]HKR89203.1 DUF1338 family protein [Phenylobacterium sp.]
MSDEGFRQLESLVCCALGAAAAREALDTLVLPEALRDNDGPTVSRAACAMALNAALFHGLLERAPTGAAYVDAVRADGGKILLDHGAIRTVTLPSGPTGALPAGHLAFARILGPLGYEVAGIYPLERLMMTGRGYRHRDLPQDVPQFFVSELHVERFSPAFQAVAEHVFGSTRDPLDETAVAALDQLAHEGACELELARKALPTLVAAFGRWHDVPSLLAYQALLAESPEAAWIATEGFAFNHATDRVADVDSLSEAQRRLGRPIKPAVERSASGRVRQTAFKADPVEREFHDGARTVHRLVPGSFYEFITRELLDQPQDGVTLDLAFDSANAQGIFKMTATV